MTTTKWLNPNSAALNIPAAVRAWAENQAVRIIQTNEVLSRWERFDGEKLVVRG